MLAVGLFVAFWAVLGLGVFFMGFRGGPTGAPPARQARSYASRRAASVIFAIVYVGFGVVLPFVFLHGNNASASGQVGGVRLNATEKAGRVVFGEHCAVCHTLAAANAIGKVGPNLDTIMPSEQLVLHTLANGCLQSPPSGDTQQTCLGEGTMPAMIVQGRLAQQVAAFVAKVAGKE